MKRTGSVQMAELNCSTYCCNPFGTHNKRIKRDLRTISKELCEKFSLSSTSKACSNCLKKMRTTEIQGEQSIESSENEQHSGAGERQESWLKD